MTQIIPLNNRPNTPNRIDTFLEDVRPHVTSIANMIGGYQDQKRKKALGEKLAAATGRPEFADLVGIIPPEKLGDLYVSLLGESRKSDLQRLIGDDLNPQQNNMQSQAQGSIGPQDTQAMQPGQTQQQSPDRSYDQKTQQLALLNPQLAQIRERQKAAGEKRFESERKYHTQFSKPAEEKITGMRESTLKKQNALEYARNAIESGDVGALSLNAFADMIGGKAGDALRTAKGAQLTTAAKENLLSNMSRVSAKAQNVWFEKRLNDMFPKTGQPKLTNLTTQEMLEGENLYERAYVNAFDKLSEEDMNQYGYVRKDIDKRVSKDMADKEREIFDRSLYRMREIQEEEMGIKKLEANLNKKVDKGTPLTETNAKLLLKKYGKDALKVATSLGYDVPSDEEFFIYKAPTREYWDYLNG